jgi:hypothetical protein
MMGRLTSPTGLAKPPDAMTQDIERSVAKPLTPSQRRHRIYLIVAAVSLEIIVIGLCLGSLTLLRSLGVIEASFSIQKEGLIVGATAIVAAFVIFHWMFSHGLRAWVKVLTVMFLVFVVAINIGIVVQSQQRNWLATAERAAHMHPPGWYATTRQATTSTRQSTTSFTNNSSGASGSSVDEMGALLFIDPLWRRHSSITFPKVEWIHVYYSKVSKIGTFGKKLVESHGNSSVLGPHTRSSSCFMLGQEILRDVGELRYDRESLEFFLEGARLEAGEKRSIIDKREAIVRIDRHLRLVPIACKEAVDQEILEATEVLRLLLSSEDVPTSTAPGSSPSLPSSRPTLFPAP